MIKINSNNEIQINCHKNEQFIIHNQSDGYYIEVVEKVSPQTTTDLVEQLKRRPKEIDVEETREDWDGSEIKSTGKGMNMREFLKEHNL